MPALILSFTLRNVYGISSRFGRARRDAMQGARRSHSELWRRCATPQCACLAWNKSGTYSVHIPKHKPSPLIPILTHNVTDEIDGFFRLARREDAQGRLLQGGATPPDGKRRDFMSRYG